MITIRGQILVSRTDDDPLLPRVYVQRSPPFVDSKRPRVYRHHAHMLKHVCAWCRHTRGRFECTHGGVFESTHGLFFHVFSACRNTHKHAHTQTQHHNTQHHTETETERDSDRQRRREGEKERRREGERDIDSPVGAGGSRVEPGVGRGSGLCPSG